MRVVELVDPEAGPPFSDVAKGYEQAVSAAVT